MKILAVIPVLVLGGCGSIFAAVPPPSPQIVVKTTVVETSIESKEMLA